MAITILTLFHSLSGFVFGCGINENYTQQLRAQYEKEEEEKTRRAQQRAAMYAAQLASTTKAKLKNGKLEKNCNNTSSKATENSDEDFSDNEQEDDEDEEEAVASASGVDESNEDRDDLDDDFETNDENLDLNESSLEGTSSVAGRHAGRTSRSNYRNNSGSSCEMGGSSGQMLFRARSNSTGTSNRTLSNSVRILVFVVNFTNKFVKTGIFSF